MFWKCWRLSRKFRGSRKNAFPMVLRQFFKGRSWSHTHLILSTDEPFSINRDNEVIKNSNNKKLLGVDFNNRLSLDTLVTNICNRVSKKLHALARISQFGKIHKRRIKMKAFIAFKFGYCIMVWIFHIRKSVQ